MGRFEGFPLEVAQTNATAGAPQRCRNIEHLCVQLGGNMTGATVKIQGTMNDVDWFDIVQITDETITCQLNVDEHPYVLSQVRIYTVIIAGAADPTATLVGRNAETYPR